MRIGIALAVVLGVPALCYLVWQPGSDAPFPDFPDNAVWIGHGWLGDDGWFDRNGRSRGDFRSGEKISALFRKLADNRISVVHPHLCPARKEPYLREVARRCDRLTVMMYDTAVPPAKFYTKLMTGWTVSLTEIIRRGNCKLILGIPACEDPGVGYHYARTENITSALRGISAAGRNREIGGLALYCEWEMTEEKWRRWREFVR